MPQVNASLVLGFDPGGRSQFGWCIAAPQPNGQLCLEESGLADSAAQAVQHAIERSKRLGPVAAAGIDSPLFWVADGDRLVDRAVREELKRLKAPHSSGTVQHLNSLRGACLVQGIMTARLLRCTYPAIQITESHPKALLWLLGIADRLRTAENVSPADIRPLIDCGVRARTEHERDAALSAFSAYAMMTWRSGWRDLRAYDRDAFEPAGTVGYWLPIQARAEEREPTITKATDAPVGAAAPAVA